MQYLHWKAKEKHRLKSPHHQALLQLVYYEKMSALFYKNTYPINMSLLYFLKI